MTYVFSTFMISIGICMGVMSSFSLAARGDFVSGIFGGFVIFGLTYTIVRKDLDEIKERKRNQEFQEWLNKTIGAI